MEKMATAGSNRSHVHASSTTVLIFKWSGYTILELNVQAASE
jgi:hypothetical protein